MKNRDVVKNGICYGGHYTPPMMPSEEIKEAHDRLDGYGVVRESGDDEMPANVLLTVAERIDRLERGLMMPYQRALDEVKKYREQRDEIIRLAKEATNGWACYAKRRGEHDEISRLHSAIDEAAGRP